MLGISVKLSNIEPVFIGFHSQNHIVTWYDGTNVRFEPVYLTQIQCGVLNINTEAIFLDMCSTEKKFICQKS